jgi:hypothetical protein
MNIALASGIAKVYTLGGLNRQVDFNKEGFVPDGATGFPEKRGR